MNGPRAGMSVVPLKRNKNADSLHAAEVAEMVDSSRGTRGGGAAMIKSELECALTYVLKIEPARVHFHAPRPKRCRFFCELRTRIGTAIAFEPRHAPGRDGGPCRRPPPRPLRSASHRHAPNAIGCAVTWPKAAPRHVPLRLKTVPPDQSKNLIARCSIIDGDYTGGIAVFETPSYRQDLFLSPAATPSMLFAH
jgi:hypothetical protein